MPTFKRILELQAMTPEQKVALVQAVKDRHGLNCALAAVDLPKSTWYYYYNETLNL